MILKQKFKRSAPKKIELSKVLRQPTVTARMATLALLRIKTVM